MTGSFSVKAGSNVTWKAGADSTSLGGSTVAVTATAASGNGTVNFTITVPAQAPSSSYSNWSLTYNLGTLNMIWVTFSDGASIGFEVDWTFVGVT